MDGTPCYKAYITIAKFQEDNIKLLQWLANSLDLNLIKAIWNLMKTQLTKQKPCLLTKETMQAAIESEWENLEASCFEDLVAFMPACLQAVIEAEGGLIKWQRTAKSLGDDQDPKGRLRAWRTIRSLEDDQELGGRSGAWRRHLDTHLFTKH